jgi:hypothetical protein
MARTPPAKKSAKFVDNFWGRVAVGLTCAVLGFAISALSPFWPTEPEIEAGAASLASPFDIPFSIKNNSRVFKITYGYHASWLRLQRRQMPGSATLPS